MTSLNHRYGPESNWAGWWFAERCDGDDRYPFRPTLQLDGMVVRLDGPFFATAEACLDFVRSYVIPRAGWTPAVSDGLEEGDTSS